MIRKERTHELPTCIPYSAYIKVIKQGVKEWPGFTQALLDECTLLLRDRLCLLVDQCFGTTPMLCGWMR